MCKSDVETHSSTGHADSVTVEKEEKSKGEWTHNVVFYYNLIMAFVTILMSLPQRYIIKTMRW